MVEMKSVESSNVDAIGYDEKAKKLRVRFRGGRTYDYSDVSAETFKALGNADSVGKHINRVIKPQCPYSQCE